MLGNSWCYELHQKCPVFQNFRTEFSIWMFAQQILDALEHSKSGLEASWKLPGCFPENSKFHENGHFSGLCRDLSSIRTFAQGIDLEQWRHFWIALLLILDGKLLRCQLNLQILSCDHFSDQNTQIFPGPVNARFPVIPNYSKSSEGSKSHFNLKVNLLNSRMLKNTRRATGKLPGSFREVLTKKLRFQKNHFCRLN